MQTGMTDRLESLDSDRTPRSEDPVETSAANGPNPADDAGAPPSWFRAKQETPVVAAGPAVARKPKLRPRSKIVVETATPTDQEPRTNSDRFLAWFRSFAATGYGISLLFHGTVMIALGLWILDLDLGGPPGATQLGFSDEDAQGFDFGPDDSLFEEAGGQDAVVEPQPIEVLSERLFDEGDPVEQTKEAVEASVASMLPSKGNGEGDQEGDGTRENSGGGRVSGSEGVTKGSFTVRVTPTREPKEGESTLRFDPKPGESYFIYIHIAVPDDVEELHVDDFNGRVVGSDRWSTNIPWDDKRIVSNPPPFYSGRVGETTQYKRPGPRGARFVPINKDDVRRKLPIIEETVDGEVHRSVVLRIRIPGAGVDQYGNPLVGLRVEDSITIECKPFDESQQFQIEF